MTERILAGMLTAIHQQELPAKPAIKSSLIQTINFYMETKYSSSFVFL